MMNFNLNSLLFLVDFCPFSFMSVFLVHILSLVFSFLVSCTGRSRLLWPLFYFERVDRKLSRFSRSNFQWKLDILRAWTQQQAGTSQPVVLFLFSLCVLGVLLSPPTSPCSHGGSGCVNAGPWSLVAACARSEKEEKVDDEFSVKAARLGAG